MLPTVESDEVLHVLDAPGNPERVLGDHVEVGLGQPSEVVSQIVAVALQAGLGFDNPLRGAARANLVIVM